MSGLSAQTVSAITELRDRGPTPQSALLGALRLVQLERGCVSPQEVQDVAAILELSPAVVDGVARFYDEISREPVGEHVLGVCRGIVCYLRGAPDLLHEVEQLLGIGPGQTAADRKVTLRAVECIGDCDHAPAALLDDAFIGPASIDLLRSRLERA